MVDTTAITLEDVRLIYKNFHGNERPPFNPKGMRNFAIVLPEAIADRLANEGWNVKLSTVREEGDLAFPFLPVALRFDIRPPRITLITSRGRKLLTEETVGILDDIDLSMVDLIIRPNDYEVGGKQGRKAYLTTMYATMDENELDRKYGIVDTTGEPE